MIWRVKKINVKVFSENGLGDVVIAPWKSSHSVISVKIEVRWQNIGLLMQRTNFAFKEIIPVPQKLCIITKQHPQSQKHGPLSRNQYVFTRLFQKELEIVKQMIMELPTLAPGHCFLPSFPERRRDSTITQPTFIFPPLLQSSGWIWMCRTANMQTAHWYFSVGRHLLSCY